MGVKIYIMTEGDENISVETEPPNSYERDEEWEGKSADFIIPSGKLDEAAVKTWWNKFKTTNNYHIAFKNWCSAVYSALKKCGAEIEHHTRCDLFQQMQT
ncbi:Hypothetical predicted protein [Mytilus galloprovincialis]|uniref:Uncharacterized protein n=1 Tax=Mytilus galloprovincialis TaxID=29158 RepID=A0A8B6FII6_MYTGA|nr:Hypothetical predicted protein [Mytilus galloprovincialis]